MDICFVFSDYLWGKGLKLNERDTNIYFPPAQLMQNVKIFKM